ncbi:MAG TPA: hypothetical protein VFW78_05740 [Bacteroidia bacterium]|nr:hypothetical protein [Bacteroidia bacterium]
MVKRAHLLRKILPVSFVICSIIFSSYTTNAQGCSDAGFCTAPAMRPKALADTTNLTNKITAGFGIGFADHSVTVYNGMVAYTGTFSKHFNGSVRFNYQYNDGPLAGVGALSDAFVTAGYNSGSGFDITAGIKIPFTDGNINYQGLILPMDYQPGLGTTDLLIGAGYRFGKGGVVAGLQQPLTQNKNAYLSDLYPEGTPGSEFQSTNKFFRYGDILLRAYYNFSFAQNRITLSPSLLPIYHLKEDTYRDRNDAEISIAGSDGLTLNGTITLRYTSGNHSVETTMGTPFVVREARPDGLTRSFVAGIEYAIRF